MGTMDLKKPESSNNLNDLQHHHAADLLSILENTNSAIWTINNDYCLEFGNTEFHNECIKSLGRKIEIGEIYIPETNGEEAKKEWINYYIRALNGEKFSVERKRNKTI